LRDIASLALVSSAYLLSLFMTSTHADPFKIVRTGPGTDLEGDPMTHLQKELGMYRYVKLPEIPCFTGPFMARVSPFDLMPDRWRCWLCILRLCAVL